MKIAMSYSGGVPLGIQLAEEMDKLGYLHKLFVPFYGNEHSIFSGFLRRREYDESIDSKRVITNLKFILARKLVYKLISAKAVTACDPFFLYEMLDKAVARRLDDGADLLMAEFQFALHTITKAKKYGIISILDRHCAHIESQIEIMNEELANFSQKFGVDGRVIEKANLEYVAADYIFVLSSYAKKTFLERKIPENKLMVVLPGINLRDFKQVEKEDKVFRVVYCGYVGWAKGVHYLIRAFNELKLKNAELLLIGQVSEWIKPLLDKSAGCKAVGFIPSHELYRHYSQGSIFVFPSLHEGFGKVIVEAMACGLPVIATTNTCANDVISDGDDGFIVPIRDVNALKEKILYMYENRDNSYEMGRKAKLNVSKNFSLENYAARALNVFEKILPPGALTPMSNRPDTYHLTS